MERGQRWLRSSMRFYGVALALATATFYWLPDFGRWKPYNTAYEHMFAALFFTWGLFLYRAADDPAQNIGLIRFTSWQGILHGGVMLLDALSGMHSPLHLLGDVLLHLSMAVVLGYLGRFAPQSPPHVPAQRAKVTTLILFSVIGILVFYSVFVALPNGGAVMH